MSRTLPARLPLSVFLGLAAAGTALAAGGGGPQKGRHVVFMKSAVESADHTQVTLPLYEGTSNGETVWYVITDAFPRSVAARLGVNFTPKLANTTLGRGSQRATGAVTSLDFTATVDFTPARCISKGDYEQCAAARFLPFGVPCFQPGAVGRAGYSPLVELPDGTVLNASHVANSSGQADKATIHGDGTVSFPLSEGRALGRIVRYLSLDAAGPLGAVAENATHAPLLTLTPQDVAGENTARGTSRAGIVAFVNGQLGLDNPDRQGLNSTILDREGPSGVCNPDTETEPVPINILQFVPGGKDDPQFQQYSPLCDLHFAKWQVPYDERLLQDDFEEVRHDPRITNQDDGPFSPAGPEGVGNCPVVSIDAGR